MKYKALADLSRYDEVTNKEIWACKAGETFDGADVPDIEDLLKCNLAQTLYELVPEPIKRGKQKPDTEVTT